MSLSRKIIAVILILLAFNSSLPKQLYGQDAQYNSKDTAKPGIRESKIEIRSTQAEKITQDKGQKKYWLLWGLLAIVVIGAAAALTYDAGGGDGSNDEDGSSNGGSGTVSW